MRNHKNPWAWASNYFLNFFWNLQKFYPTTVTSSYPTAGLLLHFYCQFLGLKLAVCAYVFERLLS